MFHSHVQYSVPHFFSSRAILPFHLTGAHDNFLSRTSWPARSSTIDFFFGLSLPRGSMGQPGRHPRQVWRQVSPPFAPSLVHPALTCAARHAAELKPTHRIPLTPSPPWPSCAGESSRCLFCTDLSFVWQEEEQEGRQAARCAPAFSAGCHVLCARLQLIPTISPQIPPPLPPLLLPAVHMSCGHAERRRARDAPPPVPNATSRSTHTVAPSRTLVLPESGRGLFCVKM